MLSFLGTGLPWLVTCVLGFVVLKDVARWTHFIKWPSMSNVLLWQGMAVLALYHAAVAGLACLYRRIFPQLSVVFIYLNLQLWFYFLFLVKGLSFPGASEQFWWLAILAGLLILWFICPKNQPDSPAQKQGVPLFGKVLIGLWAVSSIGIWVPDDWDINRQPFMDEGFFWVTAAGQMVQGGINAAQHLYFPGRELHTFGIPFLASAPMTASGWKDPWAVYGWPLVILFSLGLWMAKQRLGRWAWLFFMSSLLVVFANEFWTAQLMYDLIYGESLTVVLVLVLFSEMAACLQRPSLARASLLAFFGAVGLLGLTKTPLTYVVIPFALYFLLLLKLRKSSPMNVVMLLACCGLVLCPGLLWSWFERHEHLHAVAYSWNLLEMLGRIPRPDKALLWLAMKGAWGLNQNMVYGMGFSLLLIGCSSFYRRLLLAPALLWAAGWLAYYAYIYNYSVGHGDYLSGIRYLMPMALVLFWGGACAWQEIIERWSAKNPAAAAWLQGLCLVFIVMMLFCRKAFFA